MSRYALSDPRKVKFCSEGDNACLAKDVNCQTARSHRRQKPSELRNTFATSSIPKDPEIALVVKAVALASQKCIFF
jgi:hypothetical protein